MASTRHHTHIDLERLTGIHERRVAGEGETRSHSRSTGAGLSRTLRLSAADIEVVVNCSITKYRDDTVSQSTNAGPGHCAGDRRVERDGVRPLEPCAGMLTGVFILNNMIRRARSGGGWSSAGSASPGSVATPLGTCGTS